jgi:ATP-dependent RNA helicase MSS116
MYTHRLGRTGRAGKIGSGLQVLLPTEAAAMHGSMKRRGIERDQLLEDALSQTSPGLEERIQAIKARIRSGDVVLTGAAEAAYKSFVAYYVSRIEALGIAREEVVMEANRLSSAMGLVAPPGLSKKVASRLDLVNLPGILIIDE